MIFDPVEAGTEEGPRNAGGSCTSIHDSNLSTASMVQLHETGNAPI